MREDNGKRQSMDGMTALTLRSDDRDGQFEDTIDAICGMAWERLDNDEVLQVAKAYYYFSIQFRENLEIACQLHPADAKLASLREGESPCSTRNAVRRFAGPRGTFRSGASSGASRSRNTR